MNDIALSITDEDRARHDRRPRARFAHKRDTLADVILAAREERAEPFTVIETINLDPEAWIELHKNLLESRDYLAGRGGTSFDLQAPEDPAGRLHELTPEQLDTLSSTGYREVIAITSKNRAGILLVDPQGHDYARYAAHVLPSELADREPAVEDFDAAPQPLEQPPVLADALL